VEFTDGESLEPKWFRRLIRAESTRDNYKTKYFLVKIWIEAYVCIYYICNLINLNEFTSTATSFRSTPSHIEGVFSSPTAPLLCLFCIIRWLKNKTKKLSFSNEKEILFLRRQCAKFLIFAFVNKDESDTLINRRNQHQVISQSSFYRPSKEHRQISPFATASHRSIILLLIIN